jgi:hypothetical protein
MKQKWHLILRFCHNRVNSYCWLFLVIYAGIITPGAQLSGDGNAPAQAKGAGGQTILRTEFV